MSAETPIARALREAREGKLEAAIASLRFLVQRQPSNLDALQALALLLTQSGQTAQAIHQLQRAVQAAPKVAAFRNNLANALLSAGRYAEAAEQCRKAIECDARYERAYLGLALALSQSGDVAGAIEACERGAALRPGWPELAAAHATALESADRIDDAIGVLSAAVAANPNHMDIRSRLLLALNYSSRSREEIAAAHRAFARCVQGAAGGAPAQTDRDPDRPLRIGVLSADLRTHSVGYFAEPFVAHRPRGTPDAPVMVAFFTNPPNAADPLEQRFRAMFDQWIDAAFLDAAALDRAIREARIDVLVELSGHTSGGRLSALSLKPAPVIVSAIGYPNSTGHPAVDWRLVDSVTDPATAEYESACTERLLRLDPCFLCYAWPDRTPEPALPDEAGPITFGSFNLSTKISDATVDLWSATMRAAGDARLLIKSKALGGAAAREHFLGRLERGGIARERVEIVTYTRGLDEHLALYARMHVALDTVPYNGTTTTCEALWMGVPVVTLEGDRHAARVGSSLLRSVGLDELVARDPADFARIAAQLAGDRSRLAAFRAGLRDRIAHAPLTDAAVYGARFHAALRDAWTRYCAGA